MNGTASFLPCHSGSIFSDLNLQIIQDKNLVSYLQVYMKKEIFTKY